MNPQQEQYIKLVSVLNYILAAIFALFGCFPFVHVMIGLLALTGKLKDDSGREMPAFFGWLFVLMPGCFILCAWIMAALAILAGRRLGQRRSYQYCFVVACIECLFMPLGTLLGVFTLILLLKPEVKAAFDANLESSSPAV